MLLGFVLGFIPLIPLTDFSHTNTHNQWKFPFKNIHINVKEPLSFASLSKRIRRINQPLIFTLEVPFEVLTILFSSRLFVLSTPPPLIFHFPLLFKYVKKLAPML